MLEESNALAGLAGGRLFGSPYRIAIAIAVVLGFVGPALLGRAPANRMVWPTTDGFGVAGSEQRADALKAWAPQRFLAKSSWRATVFRGTARRARSAKRVRTPESPVWQGAW
jgi:hypothetical protein